MARQPAPLGAPPGCLKFPVSLVKYRRERGGGQHALAPGPDCCQNLVMADAPVLHSHRDSPLLFVLYFLAYMAVLIRMLLSGPDDSAIQPPAYGLMAGYLALGVAQPPLNRRWPMSTHFILALQTAVVIALLLTKPNVDYYGILFVGLSIVAGKDLDRRASAVWIGAFCAAAVLGLFAAFGMGATSYFPVYIAGCLIVGLYGRASRTAETLAVELSQANRRLRAYAERAEEAAAAQERAHLARELHDAATQTVFSMNLTAEAARIALEEDPRKAAGLIDTLQELARDALAEMRTLVRELRPGSVVDEGLVKSLERLAVMRKKRDGLSVTLTVRGEEAGGTEVKETIFRTAREAINNIAKHSGVKESRLDLSFGPEEIALLVQDSGKGFDPAASRRPESFGLIAMRERVEALGGRLEIHSKAGAGTEIDIRVPMARDGAPPAPEAT
jgi:signal transduction histidine kinase